MAKKKPAEEIEEVNADEEIATPEPKRAKKAPKQVMSPEAIESRYQAHLEKIRGGK